MEDRRVRIAGAIAQARRRKGLSQQQLGDLIGVNEDTISDWERKKGKTVPQLENMIALARALDTSIDRLVTGEETYVEVLRRDLSAFFEPRFADLQRQIDALKASPR